MGRRLIMLVALAAATAGVLAPRASAGTYTVSACRAADGSALPVSAWGSVTSTYPPSAITSTCAQPGGYFGFAAPTSGSTVARGAGGAWTFAAPPGTTISGFSIWRWGRTVSAPSANYTWLSGLFHDRLDASDVLWQCTSTGDGCGATGAGDATNPLAPSNLVSGAGDSYSSLIFWAGCWRGGGASCATSADFRAGFDVFRADVTLDDPTPPTFTATPTGSLLDSTHILAGPHSLSFAASDTGGGIYQASLEVDGRVVEAMDLGGCAPPFTEPAPCPESASGSFTLDTSTLADGPHLVRVLVNDATGTNTTAFGPFPIVTQNATGSCATAAAGQPHLRAIFLNGHRQRLRLRYGARARVRGRVTTASGQPLAGMTVRPLVRDDTSGAVAVGGAPVVTDAHGIFLYTLGAGGSRDVQFGLRVNPTDTSLVCSPALETSVPAPSRLHVAPHRTRGHRRVVFTGKVLGGHIPQHGKLVVLQGLDGRRWATIATFRTRRSGAFSYVYRFRHLRSATRFALRIQVRSEPGYPFAAGESRAVHVLVLP